MFSGPRSRHRSVDAIVFERLGARDFADHRLAAQTAMLDLQLGLQVDGKRLQAGHRSTG